jgi:hypothetical protein
LNDREFLIRNHGNKKNNICQILKEMTTRILHPVKISSRNEREIKALLAERKIKEICWQTYPKRKSKMEVLLFLVILGFELRASCLLNRFSTT